MVHQENLKITPIMDPIGLEQIGKLLRTNLGAPSATNTRNDLFFSFAAQRNSSTVLELPKVNITSLQK